ncbi:PASTA domain-containing protein [Pseudofulvibacter geojedonensis]|uniref:PASTA domain-containing protein n=1 Tax=Pseudofulvibacter geojedonensis TaxID=1123758 RepID=A0ABW3I5D6_9FLAO
MSLIKFLFSKVFLRQLVIASVIFLLLFFAFTKWMAATTNHDEFKEVPNLVGKKLDIAKKMLEERGLVLADDVEYKDYNPKYPKEGIVEHTPRPGAKVKAGRKIYLSINKSEYRKIPLPSLENKTKRQAVTSLTAMGFKIGEIAYKPHFAKDAVLYLEYKGKKVEAGEKLPYTSVIDLVLGDGKLDYGDKPKQEGGNENGESN